LITPFLKLFVVLAASYVVVGALLHHWVFPEAAPDPAIYPTSGEEIANCLAGERLVFLRTGSETGGQYTENEIHLQPGGAVPKAHIHLHQDERFEVARGQLTLIVDGARHTLGPGDSFTVPKGVGHQPFNEGSEPVVARVRITPAGRADLMLAQVHGFLTEKDAPRTEREWFFQAMLYAPYYDTYLATPPVAVQKALSFLIAPTARLFGYKSWYPAYSLKWKQREHKGCGHA
jgi:mannose-6-phosphate isomerase-like protein (cupin superfamily)